MKNKKFDTINMIPFIDVMLVLLIIVLLTSTFIKTGKMKIDLAESKTNENINNQQIKNIDIFIDKFGKIYIQNKNYSLKDLKIYMSSLSKNESIYVYVDKETKFENFISIMDLSKELNYENFYIISKKIK